MAKPSSAGWLFSRGLVLAKDIVAVLAEDPDAAKSREAETVIYIFKQGTWGHHTVEWGAAAITGVMDPALQVIVVGAQGEALRGVKGAFSDEVIDDSKDGPERTGALRDARFIAGRVFAVGMARQAYRRGGAGKWARIDADIRSKKPELAGFNGVDGFSDRDVYAAGFKGEIWRWNGKTWTKLDSPTNVALHRVRCVPPSTVYVVGAA